MKFPRSKRRLCVRIDQTFRNGDPTRGASRRRSRVINTARVLIKARGMEIACGVAREIASLEEAVGSRREIGTRREMNRHGRSGCIVRRRAEAHMHTAKTEVPGAAVTAAGLKEQLTWKIAKSAGLQRRAVATSLSSSSSLTFVDRDRAIRAIKRMQSGVNFIELSGSEVSRGALP